MHMIMMMQEKSAVHVSLISEGLVLLYEISCTGSQVTWYYFSSLGITQQCFVLCNFVTSKCTYSAHVQHVCGRGRKLLSVYVQVFASQ